MSPLSLSCCIVPILRLTILAARLALWFIFTSGIVSIHISPDDVWLFGFAFMTTMHAMFDASYVAACTADLGAESGPWDVIHLLITILDVQMLRAISMTIAEGPDE